MNDPFRLHREEPGYPRLLRETCDPPGDLWIRGELPSRPGIAVVGSRECTPYGRRTAYRLGLDLARAGFTVVSGLARGVDSEAHRGALDGGGFTIAVLPCGIDRVYPPRNRSLAARIVTRGALLTEFEPGTTVAKWNFPQRNRIIAGLGLLTIVVEAARGSGALITADLAEGYHRDVMVVPGPIDSPVSEGANARLCQGGYPCTGIESVLNQLEPALADQGRCNLAQERVASAVSVEGLAPAARKVLAAIPRSGACCVEGLAARTAFDTGRLLAILTDIEVRGLIRSVGNQRYERVC